MNFARLYIEIDTVVGEHAGKPLGNAAHFQTVNAGFAGWKDIRFWHLEPFLLSLVVSIEA
jgi:hypothetical protein